MAWQRHVRVLRRITRIVVALVTSEIGLIGEDLRVLLHLDRNEWHIREMVRRSLGRLQVLGRLVQ